MNFPQIDMPVRRCASIKTLKEAFYASRCWDGFVRTKDPEVTCMDLAKAVRDIAKKSMDSRKFWERIETFACSYGFGIEYIWITEEKFRDRYPEGVYYVNMGDTYATTVLISPANGGEIWVGSWGDLVEYYEGASED